MKTCLLAAYLLLGSTMIGQANAQPASWSEAQLKSYIVDTVKQEVKTEVARALAERGLASPAPAGTQAAAPVGYRYVCNADGTCSLVATTAPVMYTTGVTTYTTSDGVVLGVEDSAGRGSGGGLFPRLRAWRGRRAAAIAAACGGGG